MDYGCQTRFLTSARACKQHVYLLLMDKRLKDAQESALSLTSQMLGLPRDSHGNLAQTSEWRANFIRLATVHFLFYHGTTTENTPYDPSTGSSLELRFPFLYPDASP